MIRVVFEIKEAPDGTMSVTLGSEMDEMHTRLEEAAAGLIMGTWAEATREEA